MPQQSVLFSRRLLAAGALLAMLPTAGMLHAQETKEATKETAKETPAWTIAQKKGDASRFRSYIHITGALPNGGGDLNLRINSTAKQEVKEVSDVGEITFEESIEKSEVVFNGMTIPDPEEHKPTSQTINKKGIIVRRTFADNGDANNKKMEQMSMMLGSMPVPTKAVKVGDTWKTEIDNQVVSGKRVTVTSTFLGTEKILGLETLKVKIQMEIPMEANAEEKDILKVEGVYNILPKSGEQVRGLYTLKNLQVPIPMAGTIPATGRVLITKIVKDVNEKEDQDVDKILEGKEDK